YFKEDGQFQSGPPLLEFPFRRRDLAPDEATPPPDRPLRGASVPSRIRRAAQAAQRSEALPVRNAEADPAIAPREIIEPVFARDPEPVAAETPEVRPKLSRGWIWLPVSA